MIAVKKLKFDGFMSLINQENKHGTPNHLTVRLSVFVGETVFGFLAASWVWSVQK